MLLSPRPGSPFAHSIVAVAVRIFGLAALLCAGGAAAAPWASPGDERIKHHLNVLNDAGYARALATSWPLNWSDIKTALEQLDPRLLSPQALWSYRFLQHELRANNRASALTHAVHLANAPLALGYFGSDNRDKTELSARVDWVGERFAGSLAGSYAHNPIDERDVRADGSFASYLVGNWAMGFGLLDRWWGPGWESSLILSHSARPVPALFLQRHQATPFTTPWLSWLGPWQLVTFMGELEENRHVPDARLWGMRVNFKPLQSLEVGVSRTAQWAGSGRPSDLETFTNLLIGRDNRGDDVDISDEPGNQLAGFDLRWGFAINSTANAIYGQLIGEDEAGGLPSRHIGLTGLETSTLWRNTQWRLSLEAQNTTVYFYDNNDPEVVTVTNVKRPAYNLAYEHAIYRTGYRYLGRPLGAAVDNDSETYTARLQAYFSNGQHLLVSYAHNRINVDGTNASIGGNVFGPDQITDKAITFEYHAPLSSRYKVQLGLFKHSTPLNLASEEIDSGGYLRLEGTW